MNDQANTIITTRADMERRWAEQRRPNSLGLIRNDREVQLVSTLASEWCLALLLLVIPIQPILPLETTPV